MADRLSQSRFRPSPQGAMVVLGLVVFGLLILGGLYLSPRAYAPKPPANVPLGAPQKKLRLVTYDLAHQHPSNDPMLPIIVKLDPDYVLLQGVNEDEAVQIAEMLGMQQSFHPQLYQRSEHLTGRSGTWGNLILSRQSLYEGSPLGGIRGGFGASAISVVDGREFYVACLHLGSGEAGNSEAADLQNIWKSRGSPPMVVAVLPSDPAPPDALKFLPRVRNATGEWFYLTKDWSIIASGSAPGAGNGLLPFWIDVTTASQSATQHAN